MADINPIQLLSEQYAAQTARIEQLEEQLSDQAMLSLRYENSGWELISGVTNGEKLEGLDLEEAQTVSKTIRPRIVAGSLTKRGVDLHTAYVWGRGINIPGTEKPKRGAPNSLRKFYTANYETLFSASAHGEMQKCRYSDGNIFALCVPGQRVRFIPLSEMQGIKVNPDFPSEIWAYLRVWTPDTTKPNEQKREWYYTKRYTGTKQQSFADGAGGRIPVGKGVIVDKGFNKQIGWPLGNADAISAIAYIQMYGEVVNDGRVVTRALAKLLYKVSNPSAKAARNASNTVSNMTGVGNTASMVEGADVNAISTAGRGYDFQSAKPIAAMAAAALNLPNVELLADTSAAGSSYGAGNLLTSGTQNAVNIMRDEWLDFYAEIFEAYGIDVPEMSFDPITEPDFYRLIQGITLSSTALSDEEYRAAILDANNIDGKASEVPPTLKARSQAAQQSASPDQGRNSPAGAADSGSLNDQRTDLVGEAFRAMQLDEMRSLVERFESVAARLEAE